MKLGINQSFPNFNVLAGNLDDHLRNHGFVYDGNNQWRLSRAYDLNPTPAHEKARELHTWISEVGPEADLDLAREVANQFGLDGRQCETVIDEVIRAVARWPDFARQLGMSRRDIEVYATAVAGAAPRGSATRPTAPRCVA